MEIRLFAGDSRCTEKGRKKWKEKGEERRRLNVRRDACTLGVHERSSAQTYSVRRDTRDITYHEMHVRLVDHFESVDASAAASPAIQLETYAAICSLNCVCSSSRESLQLSNCCCCCCNGGGRIGAC